MSQQSMAFCLTQPLEILKDGFAQSLTAQFGIETVGEMMRLIP